MQLLIRICLILCVSTVFAGGSSGVSGGSGGGPGQVLLVKNNGLETSTSDNFIYNTSGPNDGGGGGGVGMIPLLHMSSGAGGGGNGGPAVFTIKDVVDVRLTDDEVLDVQEFQDRFSEDVTKVGDDLRISKKIPVADFQNMNGEVIRIQNIELRN